jgi:hypothetical protein
VSVSVSYVQLGQVHLTALKIMCSIDALPGLGSSAKHAAGRPAMPLLCARDAANPTPLNIEDRAVRACARGYTVAVADHVGSGTATHGWMVQGISREAIHTSEPTGIFIYAHWHAIIGIDAGRRRRSIACDLREKHNQANLM